MPCFDGLQRGAASTTGATLAAMHDEHEGPSLTSWTCPFPFTCPFPLTGAAPSRSRRELLQLAPLEHHSAVTKLKLRKLKLKTSLEILMR